MNVYQKRKSPPFPPATATRLIQYFSATEKRFAQIATLGADGQVEARTVWPRFDKKLGIFFFITHGQSAKWGQLLKNKKIAGSLYDSKAGMQLRWKGPVELIGRDTRSLGKQQIRRRAWAIYPKQYREIYWKAWLEETGSKEKTSLDQVCPDFATVIMKPFFWYVDDVSKSPWVVRRQMFKKMTGKAWKRIADSYPVGRAEYLKRKK